MTVENTPPPARERAPELDLLRFVAATLVVIYHYCYRPEIGGQISSATYGFLQDFATYGYLGVPLFFIISGFVIVWSAEGRTAGQFLRFRFLRLYPMFWVAVAITLLVVWIAGRRPELFDVEVIAANLTIVPGYFGVPFVDGVYWTLAIELKFYLMILAAILLRQMPRIEMWMYLWLAGSILATLIEIPLLGSLVMLPHGFFFVGGAICYFVRDSGMTWVRAVMLAVTAAGSVYHAVLGRGAFTFEDQLADPIVVALFIAAFYAAALAVGMRWIRLGHARLWITLGALTYPLYLLHNMIGKVLFAELEPHTALWPRLILVTAIVYVLSWVCARYIEPAAREAVASVLFGRAKAAPTQTVAGRVQE
jgi:peptidoglycan/LPS O-acetylase OafA/YrhL